MEKPIYVIGGGLAGCILGFTLSQKYGKNVWLIDNNYQRCASKVAAGIFNPITGKRMVKTWLADAIFPYMIDFYKSVESKFGNKIIYHHSVIKPFDSITEQNEWIAKTAESNYSEYVNIVSQSIELQHVTDFELGGIEVQQSGWIDCIAFIETVRDYFISISKYIEGNYNFEKNRVENEKIDLQMLPNPLIVNCTGFRAANDDLWSYLPWQLAKGEIVIIKTEQNISNIINKSVFICPTAKEKEYKVGATYIWNDASSIVTQNGIEELRSKLDEIANFKYEIIGAEAEVRPTVKNRKPFLGRHPIFENQYIFNGFGSKTVSMGPYFADMMAKYMIFDTPLLKEADVREYIYLANQ
ncbi:MAG: NAD(P)/FAD-dependent oxidoreductase [Cytophagales bacterium]